MLLAELIIVLAVAGRDVHKTGARVGGDEVGGKNLARAAIIEERVRVGESGEVGTFPRPSDEIELRRLGRGGVAVMQVVGGGNGGEGGGGGKKAAGAAFW